jgi:HlyD family type I secretion membrane fusion protein
VKLTLARDLADCSEFRQTLLARPPRFVHATAGLMVVLIAVAVGWAALTDVSVVVRAGGRVRAGATATTVNYVGSGEGLNGAVGGRVVEVKFQVGSSVKAGDVLVRFDTERVDNEIARRKRVIRAAEDELAAMKTMGEEIDRQHAAGRAKAAAELEQALDEVKQAQDRRAADVALAQTRLAAAREDEERSRRLAGTGATSRSEVKAAELRTKTAADALARALLPVDDGKVKILRKQAEVGDREAALRTRDHLARVAAKKAEADAARLDLANLELERQAAVVRAPVSGVVTVGELTVGGFVERGKVIAEIAPSAGLMVEAAVPSDETGELVPGMDVKVKLDAFDYQKYGTLAGRLESVSPDSAVAEGRVVYRLRVAVDDPAFGRGANRAEARLGMAAQVEVVTGRRSLLMVFIKKVRQTISFA